MNKLKLHPIYYTAFVGTWKRTSVHIGPNAGDTFLTFHKNGTYEWPHPELEGTVNGEVETVEVDGGHIPGGDISGVIKLSDEQGRYIWHFSFAGTGEIQVDEMRPGGKVRPGDVQKLKIVRDEGRVEEYKFHATVDTRPTWKKGGSRN